jgi:hypothetical protein
MSLDEVLPEWGWLAQPLTVVGIATWVEYLGIKHNTPHFSAIIIVLTYRSLPGSQKWFLEEAERNIHA